MVCKYAVSISGKSDIIKCQKKVFGEFTNLGICETCKVKEIVESTPTVEQVKDLNIACGILTLNNETTISKTINSLINYVDIIFVVDGGSTDNTIKIAKQFGNKVEIIERKFTDSTSVNYRQVYLIRSRQTNCKWLLQLDANECLCHSFLTSLKYLTINNSFNAYRIVVRQKDKQFSEERLFRIDKSIMYNVPKISPNHEFHIDTIKNLRNEFFIYTQDSEIKDNEKGTLRLYFGNFNHLGDRLSIQKVCSSIAQYENKTVTVNFDILLPQNFPQLKTINNISNSDFDLSVDTMFTSTLEKPWRYGNFVGKFSDLLSYNTPFDLLEVPISLPYIKNTKLEKRKYITFQQVSYDQPNINYDFLTQLLKEITKEFNLQIYAIGKIADINHKIEGVNYSLCAQDDSHLSEMLSLISDSFLHIGPDSGTCHIASCYSTPTIVIGSKQFNEWWKTGIYPPSTFYHNYPGRNNILINEGYPIKDIIDLSKISLNNYTHQNFDFSTKYEFAYCLDSKSDQYLVSKCLYSYRIYNPLMNLTLISNGIEINQTLKRMCSILDIQTKTKLERGYTELTKYIICNKPITEFSQFKKISSFDSAKETDYFFKVSNNKQADLYLLKFKKEKVKISEPIKENKFYVKVRSTVNNVGTDGLSCIIAIFKPDEKRLFSFKYALDRLIELQKTDFPKQFIIVEAVEDNQKTLIEEFIKQYSKAIITYVPILMDKEKQEDLFQKECLWNIGTKYSRYNKLLFLDSDTYSDSETWFKRIHEGLTFNPYCILQPGSQLISFDPKTKKHYQPFMLWYGYSKLNTIVGSMPFGSGMCTAMTKDMFYHVNGFNPFGFLYGGDTLFTMETCEKIKSYWKSSIENSFFTPLIRKIDIEKENIEFSGLDDCLIHVWHRNFQERYGILRLLLDSLKCNFSKYLEVGENGLLQWKKPHHLYNHIYRKKSEIKDIIDCIKVIDDFFNKQNESIILYGKEKPLLVSHYFMDDNADKNLLFESPDYLKLKTKLGSKESALYILNVGTNILQINDLSRFKNGKLLITLKGQNDTPIFVQLLNFDRRGIIHSKFSNNIQVEINKEINTISIPLDNFKDFDLGFFRSIILKTTDNIITITRIEISL